MINYCQLAIKSFLAMLNLPTPKLFRWFSVVSATMRFPKGKRGLLFHEQQKRGQGKVPINIT